MSLAKKLEEIVGKRMTARVGIIDAGTYPNGESIAQVALNNDMGTDKIPPRPFFRSAVAKNRDKLGPMYVSLLKNHTPEEAMRLVCEHMVDELIESSTTWEEPPNAPSTIAQKGFNAPLRGVDRLLRRSFSYEIDND